MRLRTFGGLWIENATSGADGGPRPRRLALLAILASAGPKGLTREQVLAILWPESEPDRARHALSQTLYNLRRDVGADVVLASAQDLKLDSSQITSDLAEHRAAIRAGDWAAAADLYPGPFLEGFYLAGAPDFERWVEEERGQIAAAAARAIQAAAREATSKGELDRATSWWRRLTAVEPLNGRFAAGYIEALIATGERAGALAHAKGHVELIRRELGSNPDPEVTSLANQLRASAELLSEPATTPPQPSPEPTSMAPPIERTIERRVQPPGRRWLPFALGLAGVAVLTIWLTRSWGADGTGPTVLAVGNVRDLTTVDSTPLGGVVSEMLTTSLARLTDVQVVANSRILELLVRADTSEQARTEAARRAGAKEILEGEVMPVGRDSLALALRRVDLARGVVRRGYRVVGVDRYALIDSVTAAIARDLRVSAPTGALADVSTRSPLAYRLYEDGLRAYFQQDAYSAHQLFRSAILEDSTFAMATYYAWRTAAQVGDPGLDSLGSRALRFATRSPDRDRLLILAHVGALRSDVAALAAAESLAARYPTDPEALVQAAGVIHTVSSDTRRTAFLLNRAVALDSAAGQAPLCRACEALGLLASQYWWADSTAAAERTIQRLIAMRPASPAGWTVLADLAVSLGKEDEARRAERTADSLGRRSRGLTSHQLSSILRLDRPDLAEARCRRDLPTASAEEFNELRWWCTVALRMEGQYRAALLLAREGIMAGDSRRRSEAGVERVQAAWLDFEMGRPLAAALQFRQFSAEANNSRMAPGLIARSMAWNLTLAATALMAGNDTIAAGLLVDSVESIGKRSLFGRDPRLHHFIRGLFLSQAGRHDEAIIAYRSALIWPTFGFTRISYELAASLLARNRPEEAIPVLRAPLRGGVDGSGLYLTRTEIHERLAQAFDAAGQRDSAAAHYAVVVRAWKHGDPAILERYQLARNYLTRFKPSLVQPGRKP